MIVDGGTHEDDSYFWELSDDSFDGQQDEICVDVPFVDLIQHNERIFLEKFSAMNQSLQEDAIGDKNYPICRFDL